MGGKAGWLAGSSSRRGRLTSKTAAWVAILNSRSRRDWALCLLLQLSWPRPRVDWDKTKKKAPLAFPARDRSIPLRHAHSVLPPSPGPAPARDRSSSRLCKARPAQVTPKPRVATACDSNVEARTMLSGHPRPAHAIPRTPTGHGCCRICCQMGGCTCQKAVCLLSVLSPYSCVPVVSPRMRICSQMQSFPPVSLPPG